MYKLYSMNKCFYEQVPCSFHNFVVSTPPSPTALLGLYNTTCCLFLNVFSNRTDGRQHKYLIWWCLNTTITTNKAFLNKTAFSITGKALSKDMSHYDTIISGGSSFCCDTSSFPQNDKFCCSSLYIETTGRLEDTWQQIHYLGSSLKTCIFHVLLKLAF